MTPSSHSHNAAHKLVVKAKHGRVRRGILPGQTNENAQAVVGHRTLGLQKRIHAVAVGGVGSIRCVGIIGVEVVEDFKGWTREANRRRGVPRQRLSHRKLSIRGCACHTGDGRAPRWPPTCCSAFMKASSA
jgi:hypothetical protein